MARPSDRGSVELNSDRMSAGIEAGSDRRAHATSGHTSERKGLGARLMGVAPDDSATILITLRTANGPGAQHDRAERKTNDERVFHVYLPLVTVGSRADRTP